MTKLPTGRHTQTIKTAKKSKKRYLQNKSLKSRVKTYIRKAYEAVDGNNVEEAKKTTPQTNKFIDQAARKGAIHKNKAARLKSRLDRKINSKASK
jgi:small subunit ribosomal protein S20